MKKPLTLIMLAAAYILLGFATPSPAQEESESIPEAAADKKIIPLGSLTVMGSYSKVCGGNNLSGVYTSAYFAPVVKLDPQDYLIPLYSGLYKKQRQIVNEEEGARLYTTIMSHNLSLMHKHIFSEMLTQRFSGFISLNYNKDTTDESFGDGLYDYRDYGLSFDQQYQLIKNGQDTGTLLIGAKYFFRKYPNYKTLISLATQTAPEEDEKDQNVWGPTLRYTHKFADQLILSLSYDYLFKDFTDKHTLNENGILQDKKRQDNVHYFKLNSDYKLSKKLILGLAGEIELNNSNQHYYDTMESASVISDDVFVPHYYNYNSYEIRPSLTYLFPLPENKNIVFKLAYAYTVRDYPNRSIKNSTGTYQSELQEDRIHCGFLNISYPLTDKLSLLFNADYTHNISNMAYERYYRYDYDLYHLLSGFSYKF
ncbi:MAG: hypothetical protein JW714_01220 [Candidatus Omnitrophica bacterium]|nr:hypothetical protein [Candidatus Omnitrophota bacterium]